MYGPSIIARTISEPTLKGTKNPQPWQYNSRSDHHSKVACWAIMLDFLTRCPLLVRHVRDGKIGFGINHEMVDFKNNRDKNLDLVVCTEGTGRIFQKYRSFRAMAERLSINLTAEETRILDKLPRIQVVPVGSVLAALEAKACMTEHSKAIPRLHDELNSSHSIVHGSTDAAISAGFTMVNISDRFISSVKNPKPFRNPVIWNHDQQPEAAGRVIQMIGDIPRRTKLGDVGYDALSILVVHCLNDDVTPVKIVTEPPAPNAGTSFNYSSMIDRISTLYATRYSVL